MTNPKLIMLIGIPGSGKSTWVKKFLNQNRREEYVILSTDDIITAWGKERGLSYTDAFNALDFNIAQSEFNRRMNDAITNNQNIIIDRTNVSKKSRSKILNKFPKNYTKIAYVFRVDPDELKRRLDTRAKEEGKFIPPHVVTSMEKSFQFPDLGEFDEIYIV